MNFYFQHDEIDCGLACLRMILSHYGSYLSPAEAKENSYILKTGVSFYGIKEAAAKFGLNSLASKLKIEELVKACTELRKFNKKYYPCILHWHQNHFVVLKNIRKNIFSGKYKFYIADPGHGIIKLNEKEFLSAWQNADNTGIAMFFQPNENFVKQLKPKNKQSSIIRF